MSEHKNNTYEEIWDTLQKSETILIPLHVSPDPDSFGSALASTILLKNLGKTVTLISADQPPKATTLEKLENVLIKDPSEVDLSKYDVLLIQDLSDYARISKNKIEIPASCTMINIDHHQDNKIFGNLNYVDLQAHSTAEILFDLYSKVGAKITYEVALSLFYGVVSDTGWFAYSVTPKTLEIASKLVSYGIDTRLVQYDLSTITYKQLKFYGLVYANTRIDEELNFAYSFISYQQLVELGIDGDRQATIGDLTKMYKYVTEPNIKFGIVIKESEPGKFKASLRTQESGTFNVANIASKVSNTGGGHVMSAGFMIMANSFDEILERVREAVRSVSD